MTTTEPPEEGVVWYSRLYMAHAVIDGKATPAEKAHGWRQAACGLWLGIWNLGREPTVFRLGDDPDKWFYPVCRRCRASTAKYEAARGRG